MLERYFTQQTEVINKYVESADDYQMTVRDYVVRLDATAKAITITLPGVTESAGRFYSILARAVGSNAVTITDKGDSESWTDVVLNEAGECCLLYSDGMVWHNALVAYNIDTTAPSTGTDGTISSRSANALGECNGFLVIGGKYVPFWDDITP
jgi:hypothetical protein